MASKSDLLQGTLDLLLLKMLALEPLRVTSHRDDWHQHLLVQAGGRGQWRQRLLGALRLGRMVK